MLPPFLNGCAVFATKHALALAHASGGGKRKRRVPYPECKWRAPQAVCTSAARKIRVPLVARQRRSLSAGLVSCFVRRADIDELACGDEYSGKRKKPYQLLFARRSSLVPLRVGDELGVSDRQRVTGSKALRISNNRCSVRASACSRHLGFSYLKSRPLRHLSEKPVIRPSAAS
jgi:hypothetical protein